MRLQISSAVLGLMVAFSLLTPYAFANSIEKAPGEAPPNPLILVADYKCQLIVYREDHSKGFTKIFNSSFASGSHGGMSLAFGEGEDVVTIQASYNWMSVYWEQKGEVLAVGIFAVTNPSLESRVILMRNPKNMNEQVSMDCAPDMP